MVYSICKQPRLRLFTRGGKVKKKGLIGIGWVVVAASSSLAGKGM